MSEIIPSHVCKLFYVMAIKRAGAIDMVDISEEDEKQQYGAKVEDKSVTLMQLWQSSKVLDTEAVSSDIKWSIDLFEGFLVMSKPKGKIFESEVYVDTLKIDKLYPNSMTIYKNSRNRTLKLRYNTSSLFLQDSNSFNICLKGIMIGAKWIIKNMLNNFKEFSSIYIKTMTQFKLLLDELTIMINAMGYSKVDTITKGVNLSVLKNNRKILVQNLGERMSIKLEHIHFDYYKVIDVELVSWNLKFNFGHFTKMIKQIIEKFDQNAMISYLLYDHSVLIELWLLNNIMKNNLKLDMFKNNPNVIAYILYMTKMIKIEVSIVTKMLGQSTNNKDIGKYIDWVHNYKFGTSCEAVNKFFSDLQKKCNELAYIFTNNDAIFNLVTGLVKIILVKNYFYYPTIQDKQTSEFILGLIFYKYLPMFKTVDLSIASQLLTSIDNYAKIEDLLKKDLISGRTNSLVNRLTEVLVYKNVPVLNISILDYDEKPSLNLKDRDGDINTKFAKHVNDRFPDSEGRYLDKNLFYTFIATFIDHYDSVFLGILRVYMVLNADDPNIIEGHKYNLVHFDDNKNLWCKFKKERKSIIIHLSIRTHGKSSGHANMLIINNINKTISIFEPHGYSGFYVSKTTKGGGNLYRIIREYLHFESGGCFGDYLFYNPLTTNLRVDIQTVVEDDLGMCETFSFNMAIMSAMNPEVPIKMLSIYNIAARVQNFKMEVLSNKSSKFEDCVETDIQNTLNNFKYAHWLFFKNTIQFLILFSKMYKTHPSKLTNLYIYWSNMSHLYASNMVITLLLFINIKFDHEKIYFKQARQTLIKETDYDDISKKLIYLKEVMLSNSSKKQKYDRIIEILNKWGVQMNKSYIENFLL